jgi:predicted dehydrogenase
MRVIVVGAGSIGRRHHGNLAILGVDAQLVPYRDYSDGVLDSVPLDGVVIATATQVRLPLIAACAARNLPFYVEKPLAFGAQSLSEVQAAAAPVATRSMVGFMMRYHPAYRELARMDLRDIYRFDFEIGHDVRQWRANWRFAESYAARPDGGGVLLDLCHEIDMALTLFPNTGLANVKSLGHVNFPGVDFATRVTLDGPALGEVKMDYLSPLSLRRACFRGTSQTIDFDFAQSHYVINTDNARRIMPITFDRNDMFLTALRDWLALLSGEQVSDVEHLPRFDLVQPSCALIARAWEDRKFTGNVSGNYT